MTINKKSARGVIRRGPSGDLGSKDFIKMKDGDTVTVVPVVSTENIMSVDVHGFWELNPAVTFTCLAGTKDGCPGCDLDNEAGYRAFLPVLDENGELKVFPFGIGIERKLVVLENEIGDIVGLRLRASRSGNGLKTRYEVINTGKRVEVEVDEEEALSFVESKIEIKSHDQVVEELEAAGLMKNGSSKKSKRADEDEDDEEEDEAPVKAKGKKVVKDEEEEEETPRAHAKAVKKPVVKSVKKTSKSRKDDDDDDDWEE